MSFDDEFIRSRIMSGHEHTPADPHAALASLKPAMRQARRRRHAALGAMTAALVGAGALGIVALSSATGSTDLRNSTRGEVLPTPDTNNDALPTSTVQLPETTSTTPPPDDDSLIISATTPRTCRGPQLRRDESADIGRTDGRVDHTQPARNAIVDTSATRPDNASEHHCHAGNDDSGNDDDFGALCDDHSVDHDRAAHRLRPTDNQQQLWIGDHRILR